MNLIKSISKQNANSKRNDITKSLTTVVSETNHSKVHFQTDSDYIKFDSIQIKHSDFTNIGKSIEKFKHCIEKCIRKQVLENQIKNDIYLKEPKTAIKLNKLIDYFNNENDNSNNNEKFSNVLYKKQFETYFNRDLIDLKKDPYFTKSRSQIFKKKKEMTNILKTL